jgi:hypothetical protein
LLYKAAATDPTIFNDVTDTQTNSCTHCYCTKFGYPTAKGFDAATGNVRARARATSHHCDRV